MCKPTLHGIAIERADHALRPDRAGGETLGFVRVGADTPDLVAMRDEKIAIRLA